MIMITSFANPRVAQAFVDYMATQGIILTIQTHEQTDIWLANDSQESRVRAELEQFLANPGDSRYLAASWNTGHTGGGLRYQRYPFLATISQKAGPFTMVIMAACVLVYLLMQIVGDRAVMTWLAWPYKDSLHYELWRYFSHALMHFSIMHIAFNLLWWWYLGGPVEKRLGSGKLITLTLVSALLSGFVQAKFGGPLFGGLSGVVYALMGYVWLRGERDPESGIYMQRGLMGFALLWIVIGFFDVLGMSIANAAHITGLVVGLAMALVDTMHARKRT
ncbi:rhomboid family intramembrane serine protease GlpG [Buttiauxella sp. A2-C1_F]|uniref:rhomboid family intramembrane serine protease GlpG n=1 Tax=Buttiauxella TaxID=82976 RepID=UPI00125EA5F1|nr:MULTISPECIES: rhomboid family intramembrane serine protease GlpG [Buttiauxella]MCE0801577.1 rhomboid family intramembrane serine protease GlpG [Buttiauxella sp. W03-F01]MCE0813109.1 rhomboid family intramembrane serine protease GlpG [Buttiauxella sp. S04-F03]MCE0844481.1 rhomboid family intramembrane serine protease GlpG [Buttiauxella sp. A2-C1_F]